MDVFEASGSRQETPEQIPGKVRSGFPSGIASKQRDRAVQRFHETMNRSSRRRLRAPAASCR
ncbi:MAG: hypothetical protein E5V46_17630 [Mesorhizobium sp.]|nr:MAG: hypothetical protein E5V46_17630 [Mesorhizobium sp.]